MAFYLFYRIVKETDSSFHPFHSNSTEEPVFRFPFFFTCRNERPIWGEMENHRNSAAQPIEMESIRIEMKLRTADWSRFLKWWTDFVRARTFICIKYIAKISRFIKCFRWLFWEKRFAYFGMRNYRLIQTRPEFDDAMDLSWSLIFSHQIHSFLQAIWSSVFSTPEVSDKLIGYFSLFKRRTIYASRNKWSYVTVQSYSELIRFLLRMPVRLINESLLLFALK